MKAKIPREQQKNKVYNFSTARIVKVGTLARQDRR